MNRLFALSLFAVLLALSPLAPAAPPEKDPPLKKDAKPVVVPFELLKSGHMAIQVKINDKGPYRLIFDTGAPTNLVNNKVAKEAGLLEKGDKTAPLFGAAMAPKTISKLEIGGLKLEGMPTMVMDHPTVSAIAAAVGPVEGIVGFPFFGRYKMSIDYEKKEMTLTPNGYVPADVTQLLKEKMLAGSSGKKPEPAVLVPAAVWGFDVSRDKDDEDAGVTVGKVLAKSPAALGGLKEGDRLLTLDGRWTDTVSDTFLAASLAKPGKSVTLVVKRGEKEMKLTVTPGKGL